jgi:hypothetical protein
MLICRRYGTLDDDSEDEWTDDDQSDLYDDDCRAKVSRWVDGAVLGPSAHCTPTTTRRKRPAYEVPDQQDSQGDDDDDDRQVRREVRF